MAIGRAAGALRLHPRITCSELLLLLLLLPPSLQPEPPSPFSVNFVNDLQIRNPKTPLTDLHASPSLSSPEMLEYEWGNPSSVMLDAADEDSDRGRHFFGGEPHAFNDGMFATVAAGAAAFHHHPPQPPQPSFHPFCDPRSAAYYSSAPYPMQMLQPPHGTLVGLDVVGGGSGGYMVVPKSEDVSAQSQPALDFTSRLGLNLGGRTYFSAADEDFVSRLYRRPPGRPAEALPGMANTPRCQAEGCGADLTHAKHYHRRHKVCEYHSKAATVVAGGLTQRFCQQCSRFHLLCEFDNGKRSCRKRLADHNRRRRKSQHSINHDHHKAPLVEGAGRSSPSDGLAGSASESGGQYSSSSATVAISPPRMSLDCFRGRPHH